MKKIFTAISCFTILMSCNNNTSETKQGTEKNTLKKLEWLCATWTNTSEDGVFSESWQKANDTLMRGTGQMVLANGDTAFSEDIAIFLKADTIYYTAAVGDQNDGKPVFFKLVSEANNEFIFENKAHDFPQRIIYQTRNDSLLARVEGIENGKERAEFFNMKKAD